MTTSRISPSVLKDVVAYVDVWSASKTENYSDPFIQQLQELGAKVSKTFNKQVTHVVFKHGHQSTWNKAKKMGVKIVSVHWVARCKETVEHAEEALYPAHHEESKLSQLKKRTHRCMQPRNAPVSTPKQLKRKLDKMMEDLARSSPVVVSDTSPFIIDEEHGIVYSPSSRRADTMAQRLREMRAQRENLSPTASQIQDSELDDSPRPSLGNTPTDLSKQLDEEEETGLSDARRSSNSDEGEQQYHDLPSVKKTLSVRSKKESLDSGVTFSSLNKTKETVKVPASPKTKRPRRSCSGLAKQSFLDSFVHKTSSKSLTLDPEPEEEEVPDESRRSSYNSKKSEISSPLSSVTSRVSQNPLCLKETTADINVSDSGRRPSLSNRSTKAQSKEQDSLKSEEKKQKVLKKKKQAAVVTDCKEVLKPSGGDDDDSVFEDYFSSAKNTPGRRVSFVDSSKSLDLPTFDLVPQNRNRRKSSSQMTLPANTKPEKTVNSKSRHISDASFSTQVFDKVSNEPLTKTVKNTPGHKGSFVDSSKSLDLPTFDLVPQHRNGRKSSSQETFKANAKPEKTVDRGSVVDSSKSLDLPTFDLVPQNRNRRKNSSLETFSANSKLEKNVHSKPQHSSETSLSTQVSDTVSNGPITKTGGPGCESSVSNHEEPKQEPAAKRQRRRTQQNLDTSKDNKSSTSDGLTDRCSEMCSKQGSMKTDKYMKKNRTLVMTSMPTDKQQTVLQVVNSLGSFTVVDSVCESTTHVVSGSPRRTLNILLGIARGCWILSFEWILWCLEQRKWIPEEPYELSDHFPAAPICRLQQHLSAGEHQQDLFQDQPVMFVSPLSQPPCRSLVELIQLCGGCVSRSVRQASLCIGEYKGKKPEGTRCLSEQWILDCVTNLVLLPYNNYVLE
ncbi:microcephalin isoform X3 [Astyanax mexicanus]|uniref:Microcephalin isoform X3 n=1 Tax=Astyanax mexicanus TaxID=7994 RepID=A0A8T2LYH3_ASTMX|nr:microcephalin isoform X3 [Astyanax mexicanus]